MYNSFHGSVEVSSTERDNVDDDEDNRVLNMYQVAIFLVENFDLADYVWGTMNYTNEKVIKRVAHMVNLFVVQAQDIDKDAIKYKDLLRAFRERVELKLPIAAFFHIGINACVELQNQENEMIEKVFQFYSQIDVTENLITSDLETKDVLTDLNFEGMSFTQFLLYLIDTEQPIAATEHRQFVYEIFKNTLEIKQKTRLNCDDFIVTIRKHHLLPAKELLEKAM